MTGNADHNDDAGHRPARSGSPARQLRLRLRAAVFPMAAMLGLVLLLIAGCAGAPAGSHNQAPPGGASADMGKLLAYSKCMRGHGVSDFPDPTQDGGGVAISYSGNSQRPQFKAAELACKSLLPQAPPQSAEQLDTDVKLAACMRAHGVAGFPDPDNQGAFDLSNVDRNSPSFQSAFKTCVSETHFKGPMRVHSGGHGS